MYRKDRVALYCRISKTGDEGKTALEAREKKFMEIIKENSDIMEFAGIYTDFGSANNKHRPKLERLIADCEAGKIDLIITKNMAQLYRSTAKILDLIQKLRKFKPSIRVHFEDSGFDSGHVDFFEIMESMVESEKIAVKDYILT